MVAGRWCTELTNRTIIILTTRPTRTRTGNQVSTITLAALGLSLSTVLSTVELHAQEFDPFSAPFSAVDGDSKETEQ